MFMPENDIIELILVTQNVHTPALVTSTKLPMKSILTPATLPSTNGPHTSESWAPAIVHNRAIHATKADALLHRQPVMSRAPFVNGRHNNGAQAIGMLSGTMPVSTTTAAPSVSTGTGTVNGFRTLATPTVAPSAIIGSRSVMPPPTSAVSRTNAAKGPNSAIASLSQSSDSIKRREAPVLDQNPALAINGQAKNGNALVATNQDGRDETRAAPPAPPSVLRISAAKGPNASLSQSSDSIKRQEPTQVGR